MTTKTKLPMLDTRAAVKTVDREKRTVELVFSTGARGKRGGFWSEPYFEELEISENAIRMERLNGGGAPLLRNHFAYLEDQLGVVERAWIETGKACCLVRFPKEEDDKEADKIFRKIADGIIRNVSVGYKVHKYEQLQERDNDLKVYRAVDWEPMEVSMVAIGFDGKSQVRNNEMNSENECEIITRKDDNQEQIFMSKEKTETTVIDEAAVRADAVKTEKARSSAIMTSVRKAGLGVELAEKLINDGVTVEAAREAIIDAVAEKASKVQTDTTRTEVTINADEDDKFRAGISDWLIQRAGSNVSSTVEKHTGTKLAAGEFRGLSFVDIARKCLERRNVKTGGMDKMQLIAAALTHRSVPYQGASEFGILLENTMHKVLLASYGTTPDTWSMFCKKGSVSDFRAHNRYRQGSFGSLDSLLPSGEFKNKSIPDGKKESITAATKGNIIALSRQAMVNDDMGSFNDLAMRLGRAAKLSVEVDVYAALALNSGLGPNMADGNPLFHARSGANNIGTGAALSVASIEADKIIMASQKDPNQKEILDLRPAILVLPIGLGGDAKVINDAQYDVDSSKFQVPNKVRGLFNSIVDTPRISGTRRYMFADPSIAPTLEVAFLEGNENPFMESQEGFRMDGVEWKVRLDYGVAGVDYVSAVTNAGTT